MRVEGELLVAASCPRVALSVDLKTAPSVTIMSAIERVYPMALTLHQRSRVLAIEFSDGKTFELPFELLRVYSPSAEVQGHGPGQETLQTGKRLVEIEAVEAVGHYAIQPRFSDGHDTGLFTWEYLHQLGERQAELWQAYEARLLAAGLDRDAPMSQKAGGACASH